MLQQRDLLPAHSQPFKQDGYLSRQTCYLHTVNPPLDYMDAATDGFVACTVIPVWFSWTQQQIDLFVWMDTCIVQMDAVVVGLATYTWTLYFNVTVMPEEKILLWLLVMYLNSVMPEEKFLVWLIFSNACKFSNARKRIPGVTTNL